MGEKVRISGDEAVVKRGEIERSREPGAWDRSYGDIRPYPPGASRYPVGEVVAGTPYQKPRKVGSQPRKSLREIILETDPEKLSYEAKLWKRVLEIDDDFAESVIRMTPINVVEDVLQIRDLGGPR